MALYRGPGGANDGKPSSSATVFPGDVGISGDLHVEGDITSDGKIDGVHTGDGSGLTNLPIPELPDVYSKSEIDAQQEAQDDAIQANTDAIDVNTNAIDANTDAIDAIVPGIPEAPNDGKQYARESQTWTVVRSTGGGGGDGGGASANGVIYENALTITEDYTLTTNKNGMSVGPITLDSGTSVTIPSGQRWVII